MCSFTELSGHPSRKEMGERTVNLLSISETCHPSQLDHWCGFITAMWQLCPPKKPGLSEQYQMERERQSSWWVTRNTRFTQGLLRHEVVCCNILSTLVKMTPLSQESQLVNQDLFMAWMVKLLQCFQSSLNSSPWELWGHAPWKAVGTLPWTRSRYSICSRLGPSVFAWCEVLSAHSCARCFFKHKQD